LSFAHVVSAYDFKANGIFYSIFPANSEDDYRVYVVAEKHVRTNTGFIHLASYSGDITIPSTVTFRGITYKVTAIGEYAFYDCKDLKSVAIPSSVVTINNHAFASCSKLEKVTLNNGLKYIYTEAFRVSSKLTNIELPNTLVTIGERAFEYGGLQSLTIPNSVTTIGWEAFCNCDSLKAVHIGSGLKKLDNGLFEKCKSLKSVTIPSNITTTYRTFANCTSLETVVISEGVKILGENTFYGCNSLSSINIPHTVWKIGWGCFRYCTKIESIILPASVREISDEAFYECKFSEIHALRTMPPTVVETTFENVDKNACTLYVPFDCKEQYKSDLYWGEFFNIVEEDSELAEKAVEAKAMYGDAIALCEKCAAFFQGGYNDRCATLSEEQEGNNLLAGQILNEIDSIKSIIDDSGLSETVSDSLFVVLSDIQNVVHGLQNDNVECVCAAYLSLFKAKYTNCMELYETYKNTLEECKTLIDNAETYADFSNILSLLRQNYEDLKQGIALLEGYFEVINQNPHQFADIKISLTGQQERLGELSSSIPQVIELNIVAKKVEAAELVGVGGQKYTELVELCSGAAYSEYQTRYSLVDENRKTASTVLDYMSKLRDRLNGSTIQQEKKDSLYGVLKIMEYECDEALSWCLDKDREHLGLYDQFRQKAIQEQGRYKQRLDSCTMALETASTLEDINRICDVLTTDIESMKQHVSDLNFAYNQFVNAGYVYETKAVLERLLKQLSDIDEELTEIETGIAALSVTAPHRIFTIQGVPVEQDGMKRLPRGIYIIDGKKAVVR